MTAIIYRVKLKSMEKMRVSKAEKDASHRQIVAEAARLIRERGVDGTSVGDVMGAAGLTHGGFYRHFADKQALLAEAFDSAVEQSVGRLDERLAAAPAAAALADFQAFYLSPGHVANPGIGCPLAALGSEAARAPATLRAHYGAGVERMAAGLAKGKTGTPAVRRAKAMRELAAMVGALILARASDPETASEILAACNTGAER